MDIVDSQTRSRMMSKVKQKNTRPEVSLRAALHKRGLRYRLNVRSLPGSPDLVFPGRRAVVFVHGCFWHGHDCRYGTIPKTRQAFRCEKFATNQARDARVVSQLMEAGWRVLTVWECSIKTSADVDIVASLVERWLRGTSKGLVIPLAGSVEGSDRLTGM